MDLFCNRRSGAGPFHRHRILKTQSVKRSVCRWILSVSHTLGHLYFFSLPFRNFQKTAPHNKSRWKILQVTGYSWRQARLLQSGFWRVGWILEMFLGDKSPVAQFLCSVKPWIRRSSFNKGCSVEFPLHWARIFHKLPRAKPGMIWLNCD